MLPQSARVLLPGLIFVVATWALLRFGAASVEPFFDVYPSITGVAVLILAWRFHRPRIALCGLVIALAALAVVTARSESAPGLAALAGIVVPANVLFLTFARERGIRGTAVRTALILAQALAIRMVTVEPDLAWIPELALTRLAIMDPLGVPGFHLPLVACGIAILVLFASWFANPNAGVRAAGWSLVCMLIAFNAPADGPVTWFSTAALLPAIGIIEMSYLLAYRDALTGLEARRSMNEVLERLEPPYAIAMIDVDHFKKFNDTWGHEAGDQVLKSVATHLGGCRLGGRAFRYGGEEFAILFPGRRQDEVHEELERLRQTIAEDSFEIRAPDRPRQRPAEPRRTRAPRVVELSVSIGVADDVTASSADATVVLGIADQALYRAKAAGRNRTVQAGERQSARRTSTGSTRAARRAGK